MNFQDTSLIPRLDLHLESCNDDDGDDDDDDEQDDDCSDDNQDSNYDDAKHPPNDDNNSLSKVDLVNSKQDAPTIQIEFAVDDMTKNPLMAILAKCDDKEEEDDDDTSATPSSHDGNDGNIRDHNSNDDDGDDPNHRHHVIRKVLNESNVSTPSVKTENKQRIRILDDGE